jgi:hypothetical protein
LQKAKGFPVKNKFPYFFQLAGPVIFSNAPCLQSFGGGVAPAPVIPSAEEFGSKKNFHKKARAALIAEPLTFRGEKRLPSLSSRR